MSPKIYAQDYRVQVAAYIQDVGTNYFLDAGIVEDVYLNMDQYNIFRYFIGNFSSKEKAKEVRDRVVERGFKYAQIIDMEELKSLCGVPCPYITKTTTYSNEDAEQLFMRSIFFDFDKSILSASSKKKLKEIFEILRKNPRLKARIVGHTDSRGSAVYNLKLSKRRAKAASNYLINAGVPAKRLETVIYGETSPIGVNQDDNGRDSPSGRKINRRVVITLVDQHGEIIKDIGKINLR